MIEKTSGPRNTFVCYYYLNTNAIYNNYFDTCHHSIINKLHGILSNNILPYCWCFTAVIKHIYSIQLLACLKYCSSTNIYMIISISDI